MKMGKRRGQNIRHNMSRLVGLLDSQSGSLSDRQLAEQVSKAGMQLGLDCLSNEKPAASNRMEICTKLLRYYRDSMCV